MGSVVLGLAASDAVAAAVDALGGRVAQRAPTARIEGYVVARMIEEGSEAFVGALHDPVFGPVVVCGRGGTSVERDAHVAFRIAPVSEREALAMIDELAPAAHADGERNDWPALVRIVVRASHFASANAGRFETLDINPVTVLGEGQGAFALDALIVR